MESKREFYCEACNATVKANVPNRRKWLLASGGAWLFIITAGPFLAVMPPLNLLTIPIFVFAAAALVGYTSDKLNQVPSCPRCARDLPLTTAGKTERASEVRTLQRAA